MPEAATKPTAPAAPKAKLPYHGQMVHYKPWGKDYFLAAIVCYAHPNGDANLCILTEACQQMTALKVRYSPDGKEADHWTFIRRET